MVMLIMSGYDCRNKCVWSFQRNLGSVSYLEDCSRVSTHPVDMFYYAKLSLLFVDLAYSGNFAGAVQGGSKK